MATQKPLVLVADNERTLRNILCRILELGGYRTITAPGGEMALRLAEEKKPDVMLLGMVMPRINGREVCRRVPKISAETRIVYYSAAVDPTDTAQLRELRHEADAVIAGRSNYHGPFAPSVIYCLFQRLGRLRDG